VTLAPSADGFMVITKVTPSARVSVISLAVHATGSHNNRRARSERPQFCNSRFKVRKRLPSTPPPSTAIAANPASAASTHGASGPKRGSLRHIRARSEQSQSGNRKAWHDPAAQGQPPHSLGAAASGTQLQRRIGREGCCYTSEQQ
jgi:hypothetical protein